MSFKNLALQWKVISLLALLAAVSFGVIVYAGTQIEAVNTINGQIIEGPASASVALSRCNRDLRQAEAGLMASIVASTPDEVSAAEAIVKKAMASYEEQNAAAAKAFPSGATQIAIILQKAKSTIAACQQVVGKAKASGGAFTTMQEGCLADIDAAAAASSAFNATIVAERSGSTPPPTSSPATRS